MNRDRREFRMEDNRSKADDEYYKIQLKVEAKIKQEEEKEEEMKRAREYDANGNSRNRRVDDEGDARRTEGDARRTEGDARRTEEDDGRNAGERGDGRPGDVRPVDVRPGDGYRSGENRHKNDLKSEMMKLEKQQAPPPDRKPFYNMENSNPNNNWNNHQHQQQQQQQQQQQHQHSNNNWNNNQKNNMMMNQYQNNYEPISEFQSKYQLMANDPSNCKFYMKTGACRFGPRCSRNHLRYENSPTILIPNFFQDPRLSIPMLNERRTDSGMEYDEVEMIHEFEKFYDDVIGEFRAAGSVTMFKCCQNFVQHLRGNVYVQFSKPEYAVEAMKMFNGRFYAGRQLTVELSPVTNWKSSICGLFDKRLCPRGKACNFLHVFRNPGNAYSVPNRTDFDPERAFRSGGYDPSFVNPNHPVFKYYNQRDAYGYRSENVKPAAGTNTSAHRNKWDNVKNEKSHSRSRSNDREHSSRKRHHSHSRSRSRGRSKSRSHSRSHSRSQSRSRRRKHSKSKSRSRSKSRSHSKERERSKRSRKHSHSSSSSRGSSKRKTNPNDSDVSDTSTDWSDISLDP